MFDKTLKLYYFASVKNSIENSSALGPISVKKIVRACFQVKICRRGYLEMVLYIGKWNDSPHKCVIYYITL